MWCSIRACALGPRADTGRQARGLGTVAGQTKPMKALLESEEVTLKAALGNSVIRQVMRERNYTDNKSCAVSARYTATR
jgi:hypothetical protein